MDEGTLEHLCQIYSLGTPDAPPERIFGGLMHRIYHVTTQRGEYAIKVISPDALASPDARSQFRRGERIASAVAAAGLPAVAALEVNGEVLQEVGTITALIYPWINGLPLPPHSADPGHAARIGQILGRIHNLPLNFPEIMPSPMSVISDACWERLADEGELAGHEWAAELRSSLPDLSRWGRIQAEAQQALASRWAMSHADLHQQNVLWVDENSPWLIDWESAGPQQPAKEAAVCALEWSGFVEGEPDFALFRSFLHAYRNEAALSPEDVSLGLRACFGNWLGWLHFCARRAVKGVGSDEGVEGRQQVTGTLATVRRAEKNLPALVEAYFS